MIEVTRSRIPSHLRGPQLVQQPDSFSSCRILADEQDYDRELRQLFNAILPKEEEMLIATITREKYGFSKVLPYGFSRALDRVKEELKKEGFGVLVEIDIQNAMKEKLNAVYPGYIVLGACNPQLANRALQSEPRLGLLLPCNVTVREVDNGTEVAVIDAELMLSVVDNNDLKPVAREAAQKLQRVMQSL